MLSKMRSDSKKEKNKDLKKSINYDSDPESFNYDRSQSNFSKNSFFVDNKNEPT
jgi:hypothetical protein